MRRLIRNVLFFPYACRLVLGRAFYPVIVAVGFALCVGIAIGYLIGGL